MCTCKVFTVRTDQFERKRVFKRDNGAPFLSDLEKKTFQVIRPRHTSSYAGVISYPLKHVYIAVGEILPVVQEFRCVASDKLFLYLTIPSLTSVSAMRSFVCH
jgi:hypothetical protein